MGYSVKWVVDNLGVTRDMLRYYESEELLFRKETANNYRNYSDEDIERIWGIKLLIGIGFTAKEIYAIMNDPAYDFEEAIADKVAQLERKHDEDVIYLEFAKSIKLMGLVPTASEMGSIKFKDFLAYARKNWNFYDDPRTAPFMKATDVLISKIPEEWGPSEIEHILKLMESFDAEGMIFAYTLHGYYQVIADMQEFGYTCDVVQRVVHLLHEYVIQHNLDPELDGQITPQFFARHTARGFLVGDVSLLNEKNYGRDGCRFIAQALAHYGGYNIEEL